MYSRITLYIVRCALLLLAAGGALAMPPPLPDQFGESGSLAEFEGQAVLVIVASSRKLSWIGKWEDALRPTYPELRSLRVADILDKDKPHTDDVAAKLRKRAPENVRIYLDKDNNWATEYALDTGEPCLLLLDNKHDVIARFRGRPKREVLTNVLTELEPWFEAAGEEPS